MSEVIAVDFLAGTDLFSGLIEKFGFPRGYSHCASVLKDGRYLDSRSNVLGDVPVGVHIRDPQSEQWVRKRRASLVVPDDVYASWEANLRAHITADYDRYAILGFLEGKSIHTAGKWICSALAINGVQHIGRAWTPPRLGYVPFPLVVPAHEISPDVLLLILQTAGFTIGNEEVSPT